MTTTVATPALTQKIAPTFELKDFRRRPMDPGAPHRQSIEKIRRSSLAEGWRLDYCQIQPGDLAADVSIRRCGVVAVMRKCVSLGVEVVGRSPIDQMTLITPASGNSIWVNGRSIDENHAVLLWPNARLQLVAGPATFFQVRVPCALMYQNRVPNPWSSTTSRQPGSLFVDLCTDRAQSLHRYLRDPAAKCRNRDVCHRVERQFAELAIDIIDDAINCQYETNSVARREVWRTINRACHFIWTNQHRPIALTEVCAHAIASVSKLERLFRRELGITPSMYIRARRLSAVNRALCRASAPDDQVSTLALDHGFRHLGRFAANYHTHFGELPSDTLRNSRALQPLYQ